MLLLWIFSTQISFFSLKSNPWQSVKSSLKTVFKSLQDTNVKLVLLLLPLRCGYAVKC